MLSGQLKITLRKLYREKQYALINIAGLSMGIACCIILSLYLRSELTYDQHFTNHENIYRIVNEFNINGRIDDFAVTSPVLAPMLADENPEISNFVRIRRILAGLPGEKLTYSYEDKSFSWEDCYFADPDWFKVFNHEILYGDPDTALDEPNTLAVSETLARKYFGDENPVGKVLRHENGAANTIKLVFADLPENTHLKYDYVESYKTIGPLPENTTGRRQRLFNVGDYTYLVMRDNYDVADFKAISENFFSTHMEARARQDNVSWRSWLQPLADIHLNSEVDSDLPTGNRLYIYGFASVAIFILVVACINYMNLATARHTKRSREVGMRKILGAGKAQLVLQFLGEALCFTLIASFIGLVIVEIILILTPINALMDKSLEFNLAKEPVLVFWVLGLSLFIGLVSGMYPAFYLSSIAPLSALMARSASGKAGIHIRELLVLIQFTISVAVIACTLLMAEQMRYISDKGLGFEKENRLLLTLNGVDVIEKYQAIKTEILKNSNVLDVSTSSSMMGKHFNVNALMVETNEGTRERNSFSHMAVEGNFFDVMDMEIIHGRDFSTRLLTDIGSTLVVNEAMVDQMQWDEPLGKHIEMGQNSGKIVGVVKDFHFTSLHNDVGPFVLYPFNDNFANVSPVVRPLITRTMVVKVAGEGMQGTLGFLKDIFAEFDPKNPFEFKFLDDSLNELYLSEQRLMKLTGIFAAICIFISCLGLYGLTAFTTEQRTREIGIRKVIGATTSQVILLLARNILLLVLMGSIIASIVSWFAMQEWLNGFAYRAGINPLIFLFSAVITAAVAYITLALQSYKTVEDNPVNALRYE